MCHSTNIFYSTILSEDPKMGISISGSKPSAAKILRFLAARCYTKKLPLENHLSYANLHESAKVVG